MFEIGGVINEQKTFSEQTNRWFLCNSNTELKWQDGCMVKVSISFQIYLVVSSLKRNVKLEPGR